MKELVVSAAFSPKYLKPFTLLPLLFVFMTACQQHDLEQTSAEAVEVKATAVSQTEKRSCSGPPFLDVAYNPEYNTYDDVIRGGMQDKQGNMWFATADRGVYKYNGKVFTQFTQKEGLSSNEIYTIYEDKEGNIWFGSKGGVNYYDGRIMSSVSIPAVEGNLPYSNAVASIFQDKNGTMWFGTKGCGIFRYDGKAARAVDMGRAGFTGKRCAHQAPVNSIVQTKNGDIWFGATRYDGERFTCFNAENGFTNHVVTSILEDKDGFLWFGTMDGGALRYDGKVFGRFTEKNGLGNTNVSSITQDKKGNIWFGSDLQYTTRKGGVSCYDGHRFTKVKTKKGLVFTGICTLVEDHSGNIWFGTRGGGLMRYNGKEVTDFSHLVSNRGC